MQVLSKILVLPQLAFFLPVGNNNLNFNNKCPSSPHTHKPQTFTQGGIEAATMCPGTKLQGLYCTICPLDVFFLV